MLEHQYQDLISLFRQTFTQKYQTELVCGNDEPIYLPADEQQLNHQIIFAHGYFASALHEISHWCIAGKERRQLVDFGYWYCPDGRTPEKQAEFEVVEIKPQALDWLFCRATGYPFNVSCDNLKGDFQPDRVVFQRKVHQQVLTYLQDGLPPRAARFLQSLQTFYHTPALQPEDFVYPNYPL